MYYRVQKNTQWSKSTTVKTSFKILDLNKLRIELKFIVGSFQTVLKNQFGKISLRLLH